MSERVSECKSSGPSSKHSVHENEMFCSNQQIQTGGAKGEICRGKGRGKRGMETGRGREGGGLSD